MQENPLKIYIAGLSWATDERQLRDTFSVFGPITHLELIRDNFNNQSRGFGFITYGDAKHATAALALDGHMLDRRKITVAIAVERTPEERRQARLEEKRAAQLVVAAYKKQP